MNNRIAFLDGLRGVAILLVIGYHAYSRWIALVPYGSKFSSFPLFDLGVVGVQLFFLISGFVILMTLEKSSGPVEFLIKRWLRLFPAMLICSLIIFFSASYFIERPAGSPLLISLLPGLTFIGPEWWLHIFSDWIKPIEGSFWTLFVEVKFYFFAAFFYFWKGRNALILALSLALFSFYLLQCGVIEQGSPFFEKFSFVVNLGSFNHFGWFAGGAAFYIFFTDTSRVWCLVGCLLVLFSIMVAFHDDHLLPTACAYFAVLVLFVAALLFRRLQYFLQNPLLVFVGFISYPLYLLHENMMISMIIKLGRSQSFIPDILLPVLPVMFIMLIAYCIAKYGEKIIRSQCQRFLNFVGILSSPAKEGLSCSR